MSLAWLLSRATGPSIVCCGGCIRLWQGTQTGLFISRDKSTSGSIVIIRFQFYIRAMKNALFEPLPPSSILK